jgi:L-rhamnose mutarotase
MTIKELEKEMNKLFEDEEYQKWLKKIDDEAIEKLFKQMEVDEDEKKKL